MQKEIILTLLLIFAFRDSGGNLFEGMQNLFSLNSQPQTDYPVNVPSSDGTLPNTGYWNYLPILGLWGRVFHFFVTNVRGFGGEIKKLDVDFKQEFGTNEYIDLERKIVSSFQLVPVIIRSNDIIKRIRDVYDPKTKKTLGHALDILHNLAADSTVVDTFIHEWGMQKHLDSVFKNPPTHNHDQERITEMKETLLENPKIISELLKDRAVISSISNYLMQSINYEDVMKGVDSIDLFRDNLQQLDPEKYELIADVLSSVKDEQTGISFLDSLETIYDIIRKPEFKDMVGLILNIITMKNESETISNEQIKEFTPELIQNTLQEFGIFVSLEMATEMLNYSKDGTLSKTVDNFFEEIDTQEGGFTLQNLITALGQKGIHIEHSNALFVVDLFAQLQPEQAASFLNSNGIILDPHTILNLIDRSAIASHTYI